MSLARAMYECKPECKPKFKPAMSTELCGVPLLRRDQEASTFLAGSNKFPSAEMVTHCAVCSTELSFKHARSAIGLWVSLR